MGSFQIARPTIQPIEQPDVLQNYGRLLQLKGLQQQQAQQQALAPLQQQALQGQTQLQQQQIQMGQQEIAARQALNQAYAGSITKDANGTPTFDSSKLMQNLSNGPAAYKSPEVLEGITKFQQSRIGLQTSMTDLHTKTQDMIAGAASAIKAANYDPILAHSLLDSLPQSPQVDQIRQQIDNPQALKQFVDANIAGSPTVAEKQATTAKDVAQTAEANANTNAKNLEVQMGGTPAMADARYRNILMNQSMGRPVTPDDKAFLAAYQRQKTLVPAFNFNLQANGTGSNQPLNPNQQATAQAILEGRMTPPSSFALKTPYWQNVMGAVFQQDPQFSEQRAELRKDFTVGKHSTEINAINTAMGHIGVLNDAIDALNNGNVKALNQLANSLGVQVGNDKVTTFNTIVHRVGPEIAKAYVGSGGSAGERGADEKDFDPSLGPQQLRSNAAITAQLFRSKISAFENQWDQNKSANMPSFQERFIMPEAQRTLDKIAPQKSAPTGNSIGVGSVITQGGHKFKVTAVDTNGKPTSADPL